MFRILTVCTGNVARSQLAQVLLQRAFSPDEVAVASRGTHANEGQPFDPQMAALLAQAGVTERPSAAARRLTAADLRDADLVLGMEREHRTFAVQLAPSALRRTFTLKEFARLLRAVPPLPDDAADPSARLRALTLAAPRMRRPVEAAQDDIVDPYGRSAAVHRQVYDEIASAVQEIAAAAR